MIEQQTLFDDRYRVLGPLGSGGMAEVYLCRDEVLGREVALKVLREHYAEDEEFVERFAKEARSAASLQHPNIASVYDLGRSREGRYYIVMEYVGGGTLADHLLWKGPLPAPTAAAVAEQVASALAAAHAEGIIHRDVKPQNVLVSAEGDVKLADFGIARAAAATSVSQTGHILGTARYMSPEQAMGKRTTPRSDLYALGGVLYEMLTGEVPFDADTPVAVALKQVDERPHHRAGITPEVRADMDAVVMRLLSKDPAGRYESAEELAEDLERLQEALPPVGASAGASVPASMVSREAKDAALVSAGGDGAGTDEADKVPADSAGGERGSRRRWPRRRKLLFSVAPLAVVGLLAAILVGLSRAPGEGGVIGSLDGAPGNALREAPLGEARSMVEDAGRALVGPRQAKVPDVEGLSVEQARQRLEEQGFGAQSRSRQSSEQNAGMVLEQSVPGGEQAEEGSVVLLAIGNGSGDAAPASGSGAAGQQASIADGPGADGSGNGNVGGDGSGNDAGDGSSGPPDGSGDYITPPNIDQDEAGPGSANAPIGAPEAAPGTSYEEGADGPLAETPTVTGEPPAPEDYRGTSRSAGSGGDDSGDGGAAEGASDGTPAETYPPTGGSNDENGANAAPLSPQTPLPAQELPDPVEDQYS